MSSLFSTCHPGQRKKTNVISLNIYLQEQRKEKISILLSYFKMHILLFN